MITPIINKNQNLISIKSPSPAQLKSSIKKKQSEIKSYVQVFGKLILTWRNDCNQIMLLADQINFQFDLIAAINRNKNSYAFVSLTKFTNFRDIIISKILIEIETYYLQIKSF
jgi:hypothetical protein